MKSKFGLLLILSSLVVFGNFQCDETPPEEYFEGRVKLNPEQKVYEIGDTITLSIFMKDRMMFDLFSDKEIEFSEEKSLPFDIVIIGHNSYGTEPNFLFIADTTFLTNYTSEISRVTFNYGCPKQMDDYSFELRIVLLNPGIYIMSLDRDRISNCDNSFNTISNISYFFDVESTNAELNSHFSTRSYSGESSTFFYNKSKFWFEVKDK